VQPWVLTGAGCAFFGRADDRKVQTEVGRLKRNALRRHRERAWVRPCHEIVAAAPGEPVIPSATLIVMSR